MNLSCFDRIAKKLLQKLSISNIPFSILSGAVGLNTCLKRFYSVSTPQVINVDDDVRIPKMPSGKTFD